MDHLLLQQKIHAVSETFEILKMNLLACCARVSTESEIKGYAQIAAKEAAKQNESFLVELMMKI